MFVKTANDQLCAPPTADPAINVCTPTTGEAISNPVHMAASATNSDPKAIIIYIDGIKAARNSTENQGTGLTISQYLLLTPGGVTGFFAMLYAGRTFDAECSRPVELSETQNPLFA